MYSFGVISAQTPPKSRPAPESKGKTAAERVADAILAEQKDEQDLSWYGNVYPALRKKYGKPVTRELYNAWRERFVANVMIPMAQNKGWDTSEVRAKFMKGTEKQPAE